MYLELSETIGNDLNLVQNSEGYIDSWKTDKINIDENIKDLQKKIIGITKYIQKLEDNINE